MSKFIKFFQLSAAIKTLLAGGVMAAIVGFITAFYEGYGMTLSMLAALSALVLIIISIHWGIELYEHFFSKNVSVPLLEVINRSSKYGWKVLDDNYDILDLLDALRAYARNGQVIFSGKASKYSDEITRNQPHVDIPKECWDTYWVDWSHLYRREDGKIAGFQGNNYEILAYPMGKKPEPANSYKDLYMKVDSLGKCLKRAKKEFGGRREQQENERKKNIPNLRSDIMTA